MLNATPTATIPVTSELSGEEQARRGRETTRESEEARSPSACGTEHRDRDGSEMERYVRERDGLRQLMLYNSSSSWSVMYVRIGLFTLVKRSSGGGRGRSAKMERESSPLTVEQQRGCCCCSTSKSKSKRESKRETCCILYYASFLSLIFLPACSSAKSPVPLLLSPTREDKGRQMRKRKMRRIHRQTRHGQCSRRICLAVLYRWSNSLAHALTRCSSMR